MKTEEFFAEDFLEGSTSIYEAVLVIARRARQVSEIQKRQIDRHLGQTEMMEQAAARARAEDSDEMAEPEPIDHPLPKFEKPLVLAIREMAERNTEFYYEE